MKNLIFISHANPEDNDFARWLGLHLAKEGYFVWSDVTKLIGGESVWEEIEDAIRQYTAKVLFVLSRSSNTKQGTLDELHLARTVAKSNQIRDFILPLRIDDIQFSDINVAIHRINSIDFSNGWAQGLSRVMEKLEKDNVPKDISRFNPGAVCRWWREYSDGSHMLKHETERYFSNWFPINNIPEKIYTHSLQGPISYQREKDELPFPSYPIRKSIVSFASAEELGLGESKTEAIPTKDCINQKDDLLFIKSKELKNAVIYLFRSAWLSYIRSLPLPIYIMANERRSAYFTADMFLTKLQSFSIPGIISRRRSLCGKFRDKTWHFGISADVMLTPMVAYVLQPHVFFSDDGKNIWSSVARLHRARRSACKDWWNQHWRDRILASLYWMAQKKGGSHINIPVSSETSIDIQLLPATFFCPIGYDESSAVENPFVDEGLEEDDFTQDNRDSGEDE